VVLQITTIGVLARTITTTPGTRISIMETRTTTIRTTQTMCVLFGILNKTTMPGEKTSGIVNLINT
jgi:hypothetical protein